MLKKQDAHVISHFLQLIMSTLEISQLHAERGEVEISKKYAENCKEQIRKITDFIHGNTLGNGCSCCCPTTT
jgi:hypothetical protein